MIIFFFRMKSKGIKDSQTSEIGQNAYFYKGSKSVIKVKIPK